MKVEIPDEVIIPALLSMERYNTINISIDRNLKVKDIDLHWLGKNMNKRMEIYHYYLNELYDIRIVSQSKGNTNGVFKAHGIKVTMWDVRSAPPKKCKWVDIPYDKIKAAKAAGLITDTSIGQSLCKPSDIAKAKELGLL